MARTKHQAPTRFKQPGSPRRGSLRQQAGPETHPRPKKPHRFRPGTVALREITKFQKTTDMLIPFAPFARLVKEITTFYSKQVWRWTPEALATVQEAAEYHIVDMFEVANLCAIHAKRVTVSKCSVNKTLNLAEGFSFG